MALVVGDAYRGRWARSDCSFGGRVASSGSAVRTTPRWVVGATMFMGGPCGPKVGVLAAPLIRTTDFVGWTMRLSRARYATVTVALLGDGGPVVRFVGFVLGVRDRETGVVPEAH